MDSIVVNADTQSFAVACEESLHACGHQVVEFAEPPFQSITGELGSVTSYVGNPRSSRFHQHVRNSSANWAVVTIPS
jgi:hypothetical protein